MGRDPNEVAEEAMGKSEVEGRRKSKCKDPEAGVCLTFLRNSEKAGVTGEEGARNKVIEDEMSDLDMSQIIRALVRSVGFIPSVTGDD